MTGENVALIVFLLLPLAAGVAVWRFFRKLRASGAAARPGRRRLVTGNALILAFLLSVGALAGECYLRFVFDSTDTFGLLRTSERWFDRHYQKNADNFRDDTEYVLGAVPANRRRVTFVGDSFTAGHGVKDVADRFANRVRDTRADDLEVHVMAMNGWNTAVQIRLFAETLPAYTADEYELDVVVLVYCLNDIIEVVPEVDSIIRRLKAAEKKGVLARSSYLVDALRFLWIVNTDDDIGEYFPHLTAAYEGAPWEAQRQRLRSLRAAVRRQGGRLVTTTFPMMHRLGDDYPFRAAHKTLGEFWRDEGVPHLDLLDEFGGRSARSLVVGRFDAHPNEEAHRIAAEALLPFLDDLLREER